MRLLNTFLLAGAALSSALPAPTISITSSSWATPRRPAQALRPDRRQRYAKHSHRTAAVDFLWLAGVEAGLCRPHSREGPRARGPPLRTGPVGAPAGIRESRSHGLPSRTRQRSAVLRAASRSQARARDRDHRSLIRVRQHASLPSAHLFPFEWPRRTSPAPVWMPDRIGAQRRMPLVRHTRPRKRRAGR